MPATIKQLQFDRQLDLRQIREFRKTGNHEVLAGLYNKYIHLVYGVCLKYLADRNQAKKAVQDIFEKVTVEAIKQEIAHFKPWLHQISTQHCLRIIEEKSSSTTIDPSYSAKIHPLDEETLVPDSLNDCIQKLSVKQKKCIDLFYKKEKSYKEIGRQLHLEPKEVDRLIRKTKSELTVLLEEHVKNIDRE
jgi:RNA polymerase sigma-70 factor (ECF subfamily)